LLLIRAPQRGSIQMLAVVLRHDDALTMRDNCSR
jgi:hypothetical protein